MGVSVARWGRAESFWSGVGPGPPWEGGNGLNMRI